ncbi:MAG: SigB/SigF/SigG family RNA polymerase sigma factor [Clostridia bacterium]|nr:SigB/SigF/SigG family RNA polymerase sigma factor [Clostridia bacterium]
MRLNKVEICGINTSALKTISEDEKRELLVLARAGDEGARERLVLTNLKLVLSIIQRFRGSKDLADDLFQVGCIGLIKAIDNFNLDMDVRFSTYAVPMIIGEVRRYQRDNNAVRVSRGIRDLAYKALGVREQIIRDEQREPSIKEISERLGSTEKLVGEAMEAIATPVSLFDSVYGEGDDAMYVIDRISDEEEPDNSWVENITLNEAIKKLSPKEMNIIERRFYRGRTQMEIADEIGISQAQVSRLEKGAIEKLRRYM